MEIREHLDAQEASWYAEFLMGKVKADKLYTNRLASHLEDCQECREHVVEVFDILKSVHGLLEFEKGTEELLHRPRFGLWYRLVYCLQRFRAKAGFWSF
jgi:hypothetical protein